MCLFGEMRLAFFSHVYCTVYTVQYISQDFANIVFSLIVGKNSGLSEYAMERQRRLFIVFDHRTATSQFQGGVRFLGQRGDRVGHKSCV